MKPWPRALWLIVGLGAALRLLRLDHSLRVDELESWAYAQRPLWGVLSDLNRLPHVPLLCRFSGALLGEREALLRLPFALYGLLTLPLMFLLGRELFDDEVGLLAGLLLAVSPFHIRYCQEPRYYAPFVFYSLSALYCLLRLLRREAGAEPPRRGAYLAGFLVSHLLNLCLHRLAVYPLALSALLIAWDAWRRRLRGEDSGAGGVWLPAACAAFVVCAVLAPQWQWLEDTVYRESRGALTLRMSYLIWHYRDPRRSVVWELLSEFSGGWRPALLLLAAGLAGTVARGRDGLGRAVPLLLWFVPPLLSLSVIRTRTHFELRYFIFALPAWLIWGAAGISALASSLAARSAGGQGRRRWALAVPVAALLAFAAPPLLAYYRLPKSRMREAFAYLNAACSPGDAVVMYPAWDTLWYGYYRLKDGCRLFHSANLLEGSPAYAPEVVLGARKHVWLAGTWISDQVRAEEFGRIRGVLERDCRPEGERVFRSQNPNDDYRVSSYRCPGGLGRGRLAAPAPPRNLRPSFWRPEGYWLLANLPEAEDRLRGRWRFSEDLSLTAARTRMVAEGSRDSVVLVWRGRGEFGGPGWAEGFVSGDVFLLPKGTPWGWRSRDASDAVILQFDLPPGRDGDSRVREAPREAPRRLGNALLADGAQGETILLRGAGWRVSLFRMAPGTEQTVTRRLQPPLPRMLSVLCRGRVRIRKKEDVFHPSEGDLFMMERIGVPRAWHWENLGPAASVELRFVQESAPGAPPMETMTSATGKGVRAWPPMLIP
ncbi:MAG: glycosyltransferase family 39 protein [Elusimicrobia bacterium]|nr:glycosyltransferase family 39 protein [Elusimicrobiota bacterium]